MPVDLELDDAETAIEQASFGTGKQMIGTAAGDLTGIDAASPMTNRSPCAQLKWLEDNTPFNFQAYVHLSYNEGFQGVRITKKSDGSVVKVIKFPITGGDDSNPYKQIPINHKRMMNRLIAHVAQRIA